MTKLKLYICESFNGKSFTLAFLGAIATNEEDACNIMIETIKQNKKEEDIDFSIFGKITECPLIEGISFYKKQM